MSIGFHFDDDYKENDFDSMGIGIGHRDEEPTDYDNDTLGIGFKHKHEKLQEDNG